MIALYLIGRMAMFIQMNRIYGTPIEVMVANELRDKRGGYEGPGGCH